VPDIYKYSLFFILLFMSLVAVAQKKSISLKDSLDGKFDVSDYVIEANGFIPVPIIITEPALGGFGAGLIPIFIKKRPAYLDSIKGKLYRTHIAPDITGGAAFYTLNNTWGTFAFRSGTFIKSRIKYMIGGGYIDLNMSFYKTFPQLDEREMEFNIKTIPFLAQAIKRISFSKWYAGFKYLFLKTDVRFVGDQSLGSLTKPLELERIVSQLGAIIELDSRDNIFTPDNGLKVHVDAMCSDNILGSDYDYWKLNYYTYMYKTFSPKITGGLRIDGQQAFNDPPFYLLPFIDMRGIPIARYQGNADILSEVEMRWNVVPRWSIMMFSGAGKAFDNWNEFGSTDWVWSYGTGFRYLLARKFKLRVGVDIAHGPEKWAYYIVFGSNWYK
jgi:hypothetical protein